MEVRSTNNGSDPDKLKLFNLFEQLYNISTY